MRKVKLLWEFRGGDAEKLAEHHAKHLQEYINKVKYELDIVSFEVTSDVQAMAYMVVYEKDMMKFRDALRPHRAVVYTEI